jgi:ATP-dependent protease ClpP protease subunit
MTANDSKEFGIIDKVVDSRVISDDKDEKK